MKSTAQAELMLGPQRVTVGVCDLGTFSGLILIASIRNDRWTVIVEEQHTIDLLRGNERRADLKRDAIDRARATLERFQQLGLEHRCDRTGVVCTAAMRDAPNRDAVVAELRKVVTAPIVVLSPRREAILTTAGAQIGLRSSKRPPVFIDIGGGSTEIMRAGQTDWSFRGFNLGAARATQQWVAKLPGRKQKRAAFYWERVDEALTCLDKVPSARSARIIGIGGTIVTLAAIKRKIDEFDPGQLHGNSLARAWIEEQAEEFAGMSQRAIAQLIPFDPKRSRVLAAGTFLWAGVLNRVDAKSVTVSVRGLRWGAAAALATGQRL